jgi:hypothetical protein
MKKKLLGLVSLLVLSSHLNAEVFTKDRQEINYKLTTQEPVDFKMNFSSAVDKAYIPCEVRVSLKNNENKVIMNGYYNMSKGSTVLHAPVKSGEYTLKLDYYAGDGCWNKPFDLKLTRVSGNFEQEDNDMIESAIQMKELSYYYGFLQRKHNSAGTIKDDVDAYKVILDKKGSLDIVLSHDNYKKVYSNIQVRLLDGNGKVVKRYDSSLATTGERKSFSLNKGTYFIEVVNKISDGELQHVPYKLAYAFSAN